MIDYAVFKQFKVDIEHLGEMAQPIPLEPEERVARAKQVMLDKIDQSLAVDLESCVHCGYCAEACHFHVQTQNPKYVPTRKLDLLRKVYRRERSSFSFLHRLIERELTVEELEAWQELVYDSCTECGRCSLVCPMGINIARGVNVMREALSAAGLVPAELLAVAQEQEKRGTVFGVGVPELKGVIAKLEAKGLSIPLDRGQADILLLTTVIDVLLFQDALEATVRIMNRLGVSWTIRSSGFEAANFGLLSGNEALQRQATMRIIDEANAVGAKMVIVPECGHAYPALRWEGANVAGKPLAFEVLAISEFIGREIAAGRLKVNPIAGSPKMTYHDACKVGRHGGVFDEPRAALKALGVDYREAKPGAELNWCCGGGAGTFLINRAAPLRQKAFELKVNQINATGAQAVVMACGSCRLNFMNGAQSSGWPTRVESLVELVGNNLSE